MLCHFFLNKTLYCGAKKSTVTAGAAGIYSLGEKACCAQVSRPLSKINKKNGIVENPNKTYL